MNVVALLQDARDPNLMRRNRNTTPKDSSKRGRQGTRAGRCEPSEPFPGFRGLHPRQSDHLLQCQMKRGSCSWLSKTMVCEVRGSICKIRTDDASRAKSMENLMLEYCCSNSSHPTSSDSSNLPHHQPDSREDSDRRRCISGTRGLTFEKPF